MYDVCAQSQVVLSGEQGVSTSLINALALLISANFFYRDSEETRGFDKTARSFQTLVEMST